MEQVKLFFESHNFDVFIDVRDIPFGEEWRSIIEEGIEKSDYLIALISPESAASRWARAERDYAQTQGIPIMPVLIRGDSKTIPFALAGVNYVDARNGVETQLKALIKQLTDKTVKSAEPLTIQEQIKQFPAPYQPIGANRMFFLRNFLDTAADEINPFYRDELDFASAAEKTRTPRATILWRDDTNNELYIIAATDNFKERELLFRFKKGIGFAGEIFERNEIELVIDNPKQMSASEMRESWGFSDEQIAFTGEMGTLISLPIPDYDGDIIGILSVDYHEEINLNGESLKILADLQNLITQIETFERPLPYYRHLQLEKIVEAARLTPPKPMSMRAGIFFIAEGRTPRLYLVAGSEEFMSEFSVTDLRFRPGQGLIGHVWQKGELLMDDNRVGMTQREIRDKWGLTVKQFKLAKNTLSIVGVPVYDENRIYGVLVVDSPEPENESELDKARTFLISLALLVMRSLDKSHEL